MKVTPTVQRLPFDLVTPISIYLRVRDRFPYSLLLESADYRGVAGSWSYICIKPVASFKVELGLIEEKLPDGTVLRRTEFSSKDPQAALEAFLAQFNLDGETAIPFASGLFGYVTYDAIEYFEEITLHQPEDEKRKIPRIWYNAYEYVLALNHAKQELFLVHNVFEGAPTGKHAEERKWLTELVRPAQVPQSSFRIAAEEECNFTDNEYRQAIEKAIRHIYRGDIFQIVPSRRFSQRYVGDDFLVYRALRSINPSPYLFYFDFGEFRVLGSSPEAQIIVQNGNAEIHPIAGTYRRTGNEAEDAERALALKADEKETAEHVMLVDLARNDLSIHCTGVEVKAFKEIQYYSHVIHLVSKVVGELRKGESAVKVLGATFPAGTLSGAPKYRAMQIIDELERGRRYVYGGALGALSFNGWCNHAIMIRTFLSKGNTLFYQAGGGVVAYSNPQAEVEEAYNKLGALKRALIQAEELAELG